MLVTNQPEASHEEIARAGQSLNRTFDIGTLPTAAASSYHFFRTYLPVETWMERELNPKHVAATSLVFLALSCVVFVARLTMGRG